MAILGLSCAVAFAHCLIHLSKNAIDGIDFVNLKCLTMLIALNLLVPLLASIYFLYLWRE